MNNIASLKKRKRELLNNLEQVHYYKNKLIVFVNYLEERYYNKEISYPEFRYKLNSTLKGRTFREWLEEYNDIIYRYNEELIKINSEIKDLESSKTNYILLLTILILFLGSISIFVFIKPEITGLVVYQPGTIINNIVTLTLPENITIENSTVVAKLNNQKVSLPLTEFEIIENLVNINLEKFNILAENGTLTVQIMLDDFVIAETSLPIELQQIAQPPLEEEILPAKEVKIDKKVENELLSKEKVRVILKKKQDVNKNEAEDFIKNKAKLTLKQNVDNLYAVEIGRNELDKLKKSKEIDEIVLDEQVSLFIQESIPLINIDKVKAQGYTGSGKSVCILDTGINYNLFGLELGNNVFGYDFVNNDNDPLDDHGHGTSVSNIVLQVAPDSRIYAAKVINNNGIGYYSDVLAGLQYCIDNNVDVISFSIGAGLSNGYCDNDLIASKVNSAVDSGIFSVASTGNDGSSSSIRVPSCASKATRVASSSKQDSISSFSNTFLNDLLTPGEDINTLDLNGNNVVVSGTSFSAPFVSGGALLILENRTLLPSELKYLLRSTSEIINYNNIPYNRLNLWNALINNKTNEPYNYDANITPVQEEPFTVQQEYFFMQNNYSTRYNFTLPNRYNSIAFNRSSAGMNDPMTFAQAALATNTTVGPPVSATDCYVGLSESDNKICVLRSGITDADIFILFNFTVPDVPSNITSIMIVMEANVSSSAAAEDGVWLQRNNTQGVYSRWAVDSKTETTNTITYTQASDIIDNILKYGIVQLAFQGTNLDAGEAIGVDFVQIEVNVTNYTLVNSGATFNAGYPQINSTTGINQTTEDLFVIFSATDAENSTLKYNVTWFTNNITNFTTTTYNYPINTLNVTKLDKGNLTAGQTWIAMVNLFDGQFITRKNTTELLILAPPSPPNNVSNLVINSTNVLQTNLTNENLQVRFNVSDPDTGDTLNYSIQWMKNNVTQFTFTNLPVSNPGTAIQTLQHQNTTKGETWRAQVLVCDNNNLCNSFANTSELLILNSNATITTPAFNQTSFKDSEYINVSLVFSDDDQDQNSITFEWYRTVGASPYLVQRTTTNNYNNGSNVSDTLSPSLTSVNDQFVVQAFAFDGERNSTLLNSTTITIIADITNKAPTFTAFINTTDITKNDTNVNLTVNWINITDAENDTNLFNITANWFENNKSLLLLNLPFDYNATIGERTIKDYSGYEINFSIYGYGNITHNITNCKVGGCYMFNGGYGFINFSNNTNGGVYEFPTRQPYNFTLEFWAKINRLPSGTIILAGDGRATDTDVVYGIMLDNTGKLIAQVFTETPGQDPCNSGCVNDTTYPAFTGIWQHYAITFDSINLTLYINGTRVNTTRTPSGSRIKYNHLIYNPVFDIGVGGTGGVVNRWLNGSIDEVRLWNRTLSPEQIHRNYLLGIANKTIDTLVSSETTTNFTYKAMLAVTDTYNIGNFTNTSELLIKDTIVINSPPNDASNLVINSTTALQLNLTDEDLRMNFLCDDPDASDTLTFHLTAFKNYVNQFQLEGSCGDPEYKSVILDNKNTTKFDNWSFSVNISDAGGLYSATVSSVVNLTIRNSLPIIGNVTLDEADIINLVEAGNKTFRFSFLVTDADNFTDINNFSGVANISRGGETTRYNDTFVNANDGGCNAVNNYGTNSKNFSCTINVVFYDGAGEWNISVRANDTDSFVQNTTKTFTIAELTAIKIDLNSISFPTIAANQYNITSLLNITINNTGNDDISGREATGETINITAITLIPSTGNTFIPASNFSIGQPEGGLNICDISNVKNVTRLRNVTEAAGFANFSGAINGSFVLAQASDNFEVLGLCLLHTPADLTPATNYSTQFSGSWTIIVFYFRRRKNIYDKNKSLIDNIIKLKIIYNIKDKEFIKLLSYEKLISIPISIFKNSSPLESLVKYLKDNLGLSLHSIAKLLNRDQRTIWITYNNASKKELELDITSRILIPIKIFGNRELSALENLVSYLIDEKYSISKISKLLNRDYKTIWTLAKRARDKNA